MSENSTHLTLVLEMSDPCMLPFSNRTVFNETLICRTISLLFNHVSFFFFYMVRVTGLAPKLLTRSFEHQTSDLKTSEFLSE